MNKIITAIIALSIVTTVTVAESKIYASTAIAIELIDDSDTDMDVNLKAGVSLELKGGIFFDNNFGIEGKLTKTINSAKGSKTVFNKTLSIEADVSTLSLFGTYNYQITPNFSLVPKVGFTYTDIELNFEMDGDNLEDKEDSNSNLSYGVEAQYSFTPTTNLYIGYTMYNLEFDNTSFDASHISVGIQQSF